jgi:hypothetical protein
MLGYCIADSDWDYFGIQKSWTQLREVARVLKLDYESHPLSLEQVSLERPQEWMLGEESRDRAQLKMRAMEKVLISSSGVEKSRS